MRVADVVVADVVRAAELVLRRRVGTPKLLPEANEKAAPSGAAFYVPSYGEVASAGRARRPCGGRFPYSRQLFQNGGAFAAELVEILFERRDECGDCAQAVVRCVPLRRRKARQELCARGCRRLLR